MPPNHLDLNLMRVILAIYEQGNLTRAGKSLGVTQPAISNALAKLRSIYDDPLFFRSGTHMRPTNMTRQMIPQIKTALDLVYGTVQGKKDINVEC